MALFAALAAALTAAAGTANAADFDEPIAGVGYDWTGFYVGAGGGYRWADFDIDTESCDASIPDCNFRPGELYDIELDDDGFFGTVEGGFDYHFAQHFLIGAFASYDFGETLEVSEFNRVDYNGGGPEEGQAWSASMEDIFTVAARLGFTIDRALIYGLVGWSWGQAEASYFEGCDFLGDGGACDDLSDASEGTVDGLTFGGGIEFLLTEYLSVRVEYRHIEFDGIEVDAQSDTDPDLTGNTSTDITVQSVRGTLDVKF